MSLFVLCSCASRCMWVEFCNGVRNSSNFCSPRWSSACVWRESSACRFANYQH